MKERGILFSGPLVRALLAGTKTQTRRLVKPQPVHFDERIDHYDELDVDVRHPPGWRWPDLFVADESPVSFAEHLKDHCPYGVPGDRLWVKETFTHIRGNGIRTWYRADGEPTDRDGNVLPTRPAEPRWAPSIFMPRHESRITLEVTEVRVQRLQDISEEDAAAEGCPCLSCGKVLVSECRCASATADYKRDFARLWDEINGKKAPWSSNPFCWAITFRRLP